MTSPPDPTREPIFTPRLQVGFGLLAFGVGLMFLAGKVLPSPVPAAIATGITVGIVGFVVLVVEALRDPPTAHDGAPPGEDTPPDRL